MTPDQLTQYLTQWINKAVQQGGFNAQEAADALGALKQLSALASDETSKPAPSKGKK